MSMYGLHHNLADRKKLCIKFVFFYTQTMCVRKYFSFTITVFVLLILTDKK